MKTSIKNLQDIGGLHDARTYTGTIRKSAKPALPTTAILDLSMRRNEKDRIVKELKRLRKRRQQLQNRLKEVNKEMSKLLEKAIKTAEGLRGAGLGRKGNLPGSSKKKGRMVLNY